MNPRYFRYFVESLLLVLVVPALLPLPLLTSPAHSPAYEPPQPVAQDRQVAQDPAHTPPQPLRYSP